MLFFLTYFISLVAKNAVDKILLNRVIAVEIGIFIAEIGVDWLLWNVFAGLVVNCVGHRIWVKRGVSLGNYMWVVMRIVLLLDVMLIGSMGWWLVMGLRGKRLLGINWRNIWISKLGIHRRDLRLPKKVIEPILLLVYPLIDLRVKILSANILPYNIRRHFSYRLRTIHLCRDI